MPGKPDSSPDSAPVPKRERKPAALLAQCSEPTRVTKTDTVIAMLARPQGASVDELMAATSWQRHSVRGALAGAVKKKLGVRVTSDVADGVRRYRAAAPAVAGEGVA